MPGREMSRIPLAEILAVVRDRGETGSYREPKWSRSVEDIGRELDAAMAKVIGEQTLSDFLDAQEKLK